MLLKSLKLVNFRQYRGEQNISFSCDPKKNVTIILGNNTFGKTTLLQSFYWCFYRKANLDYPEDMLNYDVMWSMEDGASEEVEVEIVLLHQGTEYTITTRQLYTMLNGKPSRGKPKTEVCFIGADGQTENVKAARIDAVIKSIIPEDLCDYFFFDTERVESISEKKDLTKSVSDLLGLAPLENAIKHLGVRSRKDSVIGGFYTDLVKNDNTDAANALDEVHRAQDALEKTEAEIQECDNQIRQYSAQKEQLDRSLQGITSAKELQGKRKDLENKRDMQDSLAESNRERLRKYIGKSSVHYFVIPLLDRASQVLDEADLSDKGIKDLTRPTLEDILQNRDTCICGCSLKNNPEAIEHIKSEMRFCPPESIGNAVRHYGEQLSSFGLGLEDVTNEIEGSWINIITADSEVQELNDQIDQIDEQLLGKEDVAIFEEQLQTAKKRLKELSERRDRALMKKGDCIEAIKRGQKKYDSYSIASEKHNQSALYLQYAEEIKDWLNTTFKFKQSETREMLEETVNSLFERMYHGRRRVTIDSQFQVRLLTASGQEERETGESGGLNSVKNFAFIAGLSELAKRQAASKRKIPGIELEPYPLVMDAPFSKADDVHTANISKVLPEASDQVIMFVMHKDWQHAEPVLANRVGCEYELEKHSEQYSSLKEI